MPLVSWTVPEVTEKGRELSMHLLVVAGLSPVETGQDHVLSLVAHADPVLQRDLGQDAGGLQDIPLAHRLRCAAEVAVRAVVRALMAALRTHTGRSVPVSWGFGRRDVCRVPPVVSPVPVLGASPAHCPGGCGVGLAGTCHICCHICWCLQTGPPGGPSWADSPSVPVGPSQAHGKCHVWVHSLRLGLPRLLGAAQAESLEPLWVQRVEVTRPAPVSGSSCSLSPAFWVPALRQGKAAGSPCP